MTKIINQKNFEALCSIQCTKDEICHVLEIDEKTLTKWCKKIYKKAFSEVFKIKRGAGKVSLRRSQWKAAQAGNITMLIWLGKQYLKQSDKIDQKHDTSNNIKITSVESKL